jgi:DEAD/DEAH box helicase domain-containing protein
LRSVLLTAQTIDKPEDLLKSKSDNSRIHSFIGSFARFQILACSAGGPRLASIAMKNIVYLDLETQRSADEVGGWDNVRDMRMSVAVTYSTARGSYQIYAEGDVPDLVRELQRADLVVGFNNLGFDYEVLHHYTVFDLRQLPTLDLLVEVRKALPHRLSLDAIAHATMGVVKTSEGMQAIRWYREGKLLEIAEYCCYDVKITKLVHDYGATHRKLFYTNKLGAKLSVPVAWDF